MDAKKRLAEFMQFDGLGPSSMGARARCSHTMVNLMLQGSRRPGLELAVRIQMATARWPKGPIEPWEWVDVEEGAA